MLNLFQHLMSLSYSEQGLECVKKEIGELEYIMEDWKEYKLEDIALNITDGTHSTVIDDINGEYFLLSCKNIKNGVIQISSSERKINEVTFNKLHRRTKLEKDDVLVTTVGTIGEMAIVPIDNPNYEFQRSVGIVKPNQNKILPKFLYYSLKNELPQISNRVTGAVQQCLFLGDIKDLTINLPPLPTQQKITQILSSLDDKIELNNKINANLEQQAQALFKSWFVDFEPFGGEMPAGWKVGKLSEIADYLNGLAMQKSRPFEGETGLPVLKIKELRQGCCDESSEFCSPSSIKNDYIINDGDVIFSWSGTLLVDIWCGGHCGLNQHLFKVTSKTYDKWFYYMWTQHHLEKFIFLAADKATTMGHIKREELDKAEVIIPDAETYEKMTKTFSPIIDIIINKRVENRKLSAIRDNLLPELMSGNIDVESAKL